MSEKKPQTQSILADMPPSKAIVKLAVPATLALLAKAVYNLVDTAYIGMLRSDIALTAVGVTVPLLLIMLSTAGDRVLLLAGLVFSVAGVAFKFGAAPFHMWLPDTYHGASTPITLFIGSAPKLAAFGLAWRLFEQGMGPLADNWQFLLALLQLSLAIGNLGAIVQTNLKRMLAYSTVSHVGFLFLGIAGGGPDGMAAAMFYAIVYAIMSAAAFGAIIMLSRKGFEADRIEDFRGLNARSPWMAALVLVIMVSLAGVPPLLGFWAKLAVLQAAIAGDLMWLAIVGIVFAVIGAFYYLRVVKVMYFDEPAGEAVSQREGGGLRVMFAVNALSLLALGLFWSPLMELCQRAFAAG